MALTLLKGTDVSSETSGFQTQVPLKNHPNLLKMQISRTCLLLFLQRFRFRWPRPGPRNLHFNQQALAPPPLTPALLLRQVVSLRAALKDLEQSNDPLVGSLENGLQGQDSRRREQL